MSQPNNNQNPLPGNPNNDEDRNGTQFLLTVALIPLLVPLWFGLVAYDIMIGLPPRSKGYGPRRYAPNVLDVLRVKSTLFKRGELPMELVDIIIDMAEYWPSTRQSTRFENTPTGRLMIPGGNENNNQLLIRCCPLGFTKLPASPSRPHDFLFGALPQSKFRPLRDECPASDFDRYTSYTSRPELRSLDHPCRKILFTIESHDQGWGGNQRNPDRFAESYTWFDVGLERFEKGDVCTDGCRDGSPDPGRPLSQNAATNMRNTFALCNLRSVIPPLRTCTPEELGLSGVRSTDNKPYVYDFPLIARENEKIQCNKRAHRTKEKYCIEWNSWDDIDPKSPAADSLVAKGRGRATGDGKFVRDLKIGDAITVWGKSRFPGWVNHIDRVQVEIFWAV